MQSDRKARIRALFDDYIEMYASRDERLTEHFSENFSGYAGSSDALIRDRDAWIAITRQDFEQVKGRIRIEMLDLCLQDLTEDVVVATAFFHIHLAMPEAILSREVARLVLIFRQEEAAWKIVHSGISIPYHLVRDGEIYPLASLGRSNVCFVLMISREHLDFHTLAFSFEAVFYSHLCCHHGSGTTHCSIRARHVSEYADLYHAIRNLCLCVCHASKQNCSQRPFQIFH